VLVVPQAAPAATPVGKLNRQVAEAATPAESLRCPSCQAELSAGARLCVECGYDLLAGKQLQTEHTPTAPERSFDFLGAVTGSVKYFILAGLAIAALVFQWLAFEEDFIVTRLFYQFTAIVFAVLVSWLAETAWPALVVLVIALFKCFDWMLKEEETFLNQTYKAAMVVIAIGLFYAVTRMDFGALLAPLLPDPDKRLKRLEEKEAKKEAQKAEEEAQRRASNDPAVLYDLGAELFREKRAREAAETFERAIELSPDSAPALYMLGASYTAIADEHERNSSAQYDSMRQAVAAFARAIKAAKKSGELSKEQRSIAEAAVSAFTRLQQKKKKIALQLAAIPEARQKEIYAELCRRQESALSGDRFLQDFFSASNAVNMGGMSDAIERAGNDAVEYVSNHYRIAKDSVLAIEEEGKRQRWPMGSP
jgi:tetratricopeptide (TPR) repeat protein